MQLRVKHSRPPCIIVWVDSSCPACACLLVALDSVRKSKRLCRFVLSQKKWINFTRTKWGFRTTKGVSREREWHWRRGIMRKARRFLSDSPEHYRHCLRGFCFQVKSKPRSARFKKTYTAHHWWHKHNLEKIKLKSEQQTAGGIDLSRNVTETFRNNQLS